jgi:hypothetical protein
MARRTDSPEALQFYKKLLLIFAFVMVGVSYLYKMTSLLIPIVSVLLFLAAKFLWQYRVAKVILRVLEIVLLSVMPILLLVLAFSRFFHTEYFALLTVGQLILPAAAVAASRDQKYDVIFVRIAALLNVISTVLLILYIVPKIQVAQIILLSAVALGTLLLTFMTQSWSLPRLRRNI